MASGNLLCRFGAAASNPPATSFATLDTRNGILVLDFDSALAEVARYVDVVPPTYGGGGFTVKIRWMATTAVSGSVLWGVVFERTQRGVDDLDLDSWGTTKLVLSAAASPNGTQMQAVAALTPAEADGLVAGDGFRMQVARYGADGTDDMVGDAELVGVEVYET